MNSRPDPFAPPAPRPPRSVVLWTMALIYLLVGVIGHDPWRGDDARSFGPVLEMLRGQHWLIPHITGEPYLDYPPLYYWVAALSAKATAWLLPWHDGARLASALLVGLSMWLCADAARRMHGPNARAAAFLLTLGTLGLVVHAHETQPLLAVMASQALAFWGVACALRRPVLGAVAAGLGVGAAFLANGVHALLITLPALFFLPGLGTMLLGFALAAAGPLAWVGLAVQQEPALLAVWWRNHLLGFTPHLGKLANPGDLLGLLGWFAWPLWPIAGWALWRERRRLAQPLWRMLIISLLMTLLAFVFFGALRPANALPLLVPLALMAAAGLTTLRRGAANAFDWFSGMSFAVFALLLWIGWTSLTLSWPPGLGRHVAKAAPNFMVGDPLWPSLAGIVLCLLWIGILANSRRSPYRGAKNWAAGMTMLWCLAVVLLQPWFEHGKSYRPAVSSLSGYLAEHPAGCIERIGVSPSLRVSLDYFGPLRTTPFSGNDGMCEAVLVLGTTRPAALDARWQQRWAYARGGGDQREELRLYRR
jgi:4-amino-4-deoxy-L-arabinose transferase-like glycosyltransferase